MRLVGMQGLDVARMPGATVVLPVGDLVAAVRPRVRTLAHLLLRVSVVAARTCRPAVTGLVAALRVRSGVPLSGAGRAVVRPPTGHSGFVARIPTAQIPTAQTTNGSDPVVPAQRAADHAGPAPRHDIALPADPTAPRRARALLRAVTQDWDIDDDLYQDAAMVVTELVANAVDHAGTPSTLSVDLDDRGLSVAVRDGRADCAPRPRPVDPTAPRGRGLQMIEALAVDWGVTVHADGKTVWAVLGLQRD